MGIEAFEVALAVVGALALGHWVGLRDGQRIGVWNRARIDEAVEHADESWELEDRLSEIRGIIGLAIEERKAWTDVKFPKNQAEIIYRLASGEDDDPVPATPQEDGA